MNAEPETQSYGCRAAYTAYWTVDASGSAGTTWKASYGDGAVAGPNPMSKTYDSHYFAPYAGSCKDYTQAFTTYGALGGGTATDYTRVTYTR